MFGENFRADQDQDNAAQHLGFGLVALPEVVADANADHREETGRNTDEQRRGEYLDPEEGKRNTYGQSINRGGDSQYEHRARRKVVCMFLGIVRAGLADHIATDQRQEQEGDPMVEGGHQGREFSRQKVAKHRHQRLKKTEPKPYGEAVARLELRNGESLADRNGKGIHR